MYLKDNNDTSLVAKRSAIILISTFSMHRGKDQLAVYFDKVFECRNNHVGDIENGLTNSN